MIVLGIGSNIGDRASYLKKAIDLLSRNISNIRVSSVYETDALLPSNAPAAWNKPFLNMAIAGETHLTPEALLKEIKKIERALGRKTDSPRWSPREVDIDILTYGSKVHSSQDLTIPHLRLLERPFALIPLAEVAPDWAYPVPGRYFKQSARQLAAQAIIRFPELHITKTDIHIPEPCIL